MATTEIKFNLFWALLGGIFGFILCTLLEGTEIFPTSILLPQLGLFIGVIAGGFKEQLNLF